MADRPNALRRFFSTKKGKVVIALNVTWAAGAPFHYSWGTPLQKLTGVEHPFEDETAPLYHPGAETKDEVQSMERTPIPPKPTDWQPMSVRSIALDEPGVGLI